MTTEEALIAAVLAAPDDDLPRLVYADWLEENGDADRAEFIRIQCELARPEHKICVVEVGGRGCICRTCLLKTRERELWQAIDKKQLAPWHNGLIVYSSAASSVGGFRLGEGGPQLITRRGFIAEVRCTLAEWCGGECSCAFGQCGRCVFGRTTGIGPQIVKRHPVMKVVLTDRRPDRSSWSTPSSSGEVFDWYRAGSALDTSDPSVLPNDFFLSCEMMLERTHKTEEDAFAALSIAAIDWAKSQNNPKATFATRAMWG